MDEEPSVNDHDIAYWDITVYEDRWINLNCEFESGLKQNYAIIVLLIFPMKIKCSPDFVQW